MGVFHEQLEKMRTQPGFVAALDQSGGSTPGALRQYGITEDRWSNDDEMFHLVHQMRTRIITSSTFTGERILGAILFENTMDRDVEGRPTADYLWDLRRIVPFLKCDKGLANEAEGVQLMKPMTDLPALLVKAKSKHIFGTKMRSVIKHAAPGGIEQVVSQQFEIAKQILNSGLIPIIEPEIDVHCPEKAAAEALLKAAILEQLQALPADRQVMLKLTLPEKSDFYIDFVQHPRIIRVLALSGGYTRNEANHRLRQNQGVIASFSRALLEGLTAQQSDAEFNAMLDESIQSIYDASTIKSSHA
ncbi:MAG: fructose bisphosphate aldolase [Planctomycetaceae bacterium]